MAVTNGGALLVFALAVLPACTTSEPEHADPGVVAGAGSPIATALRLAAPERVLAGQLARSRFGVDGASTSPDDALNVKLPATADGIVELRLGRRARPIAELRLSDAVSVPREIERGMAAFRDAVHGGDAIWSVSSDAVEQFLVVDEAKRWTFGWELCVRAGSAEPRFDETGGLVFERLRIPAPFALDARGVRKPVELRLTGRSAECHTLTFALDARELVAPILIDPALEVVTWQKKQFSASDPVPENRFDHGLAYDPVRGVSVLFGGRPTSDSDPFFGDTWEWDGKSWKEIAAIASPAPRAGFGMTYSAVHSGVVLYGGLVGSSALSASTNGEAWKWDGTTWTPLPSGPPPLWGHAIAYDSVRSVVVLYGGRNESLANQAVWELGASAWVGPKQSATSPGPLDHFAMTFDASTSRSVVFGGVKHELFSDLSDRALAWDGTSWTELTAQGPDARFDVAAAYDSKRGRNVYFGGNTYLGDVDETWELDKAVWELRQPITKPYPMSAARAAYDAKRDRVVTFGGWTSFAEGSTYEYVHFGNVCSVAADCDGFPCVDGVCCAVSACGSCQACSGATGACEPVIGADDDSCTGTQTCSADGQCLKKLGQACSSDAACASGFCADGVCCSSACQGACESCGLGGSLGLCTIVTGPPAHGSCPGSGACASSCDGASPECSFAPNGSDCGSTCSGATFTQKSCDGAGSCVTEAPVACPNHHACASETACDTTCAASNECASGFVCIDGGCTEGAHVCLDDDTARDPSGKETECGAYRCKNGACGSSCASAADCTTGSSCTAAGRCQPRPSSPAESDAGCACRMQADGRTRGGALSVALGMLLLWARRRR